MEADRRAASAEEAEPKAEQAPQPKAPLAKPKPKPKPQPQAPHPQSPPPPPLVARKGAAALEEPAEVEVARGELKGFLDSRAASRAARTRAETKVSAWEAKLRSLVEEGAEEESILWGEGNLRKAKAKVAEKQAAIEGFDRAVRQSERELAAVVARVKNEEVDEVVEMDVHGEMEEASVKEEEEEVPGGGGGGASDWLRGLMGSRAAGALLDLRWDPAVLAGPHPPNLDTPLLVAPESPVWTLRFLLVWVHHRLLGARRWVWVNGGGVVHLDKPLRLGVVEGSWGWHCELPGQGNKRWGEVPPPPQRGVKMFELPQTNIFTPERKKGGGGTHWRFVAHSWQGLGLGGVEWVGKAWVWTPTWLALLDFGGFNPEAHRGLCRGGARHRHPAQAQAQARRSPRWRPPAAAPPQPRGRLRQGIGGHLPRPGPPRHGMSIAF